jgi:glycosyltransferase involved in cell wall biosynthesis
VKVEPLVSVVVPTFNSGRFLGRCLASVRGQSYGNVEVIVVDKKSSDNTVAIARNFGAKVYTIDAVERCTQMNYGVKMANGEYVYIVGSDFVLEPKVVEEATKASITRGLDAVCVHNTSDESVSFWAKVRKLERDCYAGDELNVAARFFRKEVFERVEGYNEDLVAAEDYDLHNRLLRLGFKLGHIKAKEIHVGEPSSLQEIARKHYYYGKTVKKFLNMNPKKGMRQISPIRLSFIRNWKSFIKYPSLTFGFVIYQFVKYISSGLGYISSIGNN